MILTWLKGNWYLSVILTAIITWGAWMTLSATNAAPQSLVNKKIERVEDTLQMHKDYDNDRFGKIQQQIIDQNKQMVEQLQKIWEKVR